ncbi:EAL domain-containing protein [Thiomicrorhabdus sp. zzn3]|uniref:sensor domain-containing protein n=1 Tax=Thiomicrorhabdus sp. zzn3 TaxID=3039775 RepID=UPI002436A5F0|nr:EAL domain-containing protein [Thiomicrorhabdus sp. zzn3]MDG6778775.1 EAL domain-containing protein [Thiomicrorhabdus sp. zzn3]
MSVQVEQVTSQLSDSRTRNQLRVILDHVPFGIWLQNTQGKMEFVNRWFCESVGIPEVQFLSAEHYSELYPEDIAQACMQSDREAIKQPKPHKTIEHLLFTDGKEHILEITKVKIYDSKGQFDGLLGIAEDVTDKVKSQKRVYQLAYFDELTHLPNRSWLKQQFNQWLEKDHHQGIYAFMLFDIDHFKALNDTQGHEIGDKLLLKLTRRLQQQDQNCVNDLQLVKFNDAPAFIRMGGDEFAMLIRCPTTDPKLAQHYLENQFECLLSRLNQPFNLPLQILEETQNWLHRASISSGITLFSGKQTISLEEILKHAEVAMYKAKKKGVNQLLFFTPEMQEQLDSRTEMINQLNFAIARNELYLVFQPIMDAQNRVNGAEALLRWKNSKLGAVAPDCFIPLAEQSGLIHTISDWVIHSALNTLSFWQKEPELGQLTLAVNVSVKQFHQDNFVEELQTLIDFYEIDPRYLKLELTESVMLESMDSSVNKMQRLREMGIRLSIDDFGTGFASLSYLKRLPVDEIKIDRSFIKELPDDQDDIQIVKAILKMADALQLNVVSEGVETEQQLAFLLENGGRHFQGYHWSPPVPEEEFEDFVTNHNMAQN